MHKLPNRWVRTQDMLAPLYEGDDHPPGLIMTCEEVVEIFGDDVVARAIEDGSISLVCEHAEPAASFKRVRWRFGLTRAQLAKMSGVANSDVLSAESSRTRTNIHVLAKICKVLELDVRRISFEKFE